MFYRRLSVLIVAAASCAMTFLSGCSGDVPVQSNEQITFSKHIAPIVHQNCTKCHIEGEAGPFSLVTYADVKRRAKLIRYMVNERLMPPWPADASYSNFANEMVLSATQIDLINKWIEQGTPEGDSTQPYDLSTIKKQLNLGKPDMIVQVPKVAIKGNNEDLFLVMKIPVNFPSDTFIRAIEFVAGNKKLVHHVNTHMIVYDEANKKSMTSGKQWVNQDQTQSQNIHKELGLLNDDGTYAPMTPSVSNYLPGSLFSFYPKEIGGYRAKKNSAFYLNDLHYGPSAIDATDSSYYKIYFAKEAPKRPVMEFQLGTLGIAPVQPALIVPPNEVKTFHIQATMPNDISLVSIVPHMHLIGKSFWAYAVKPSGDTIPLIRINKWDFRWQYFYQFKHLLKIPRGTTIYVEGVYDNTANNPNNPFSPPREIREREGSMKTTDEMFQLIVTYVPYQKGDENINLENANP